MNKVSSFKSFLFLIPFLLFFASSAFAITPSPVSKNDSVKQFVIRKVVLIGNKRTKNQILYRELFFHVGDTLEESNLEKILQKSKENLLNTLLLNIADIQRVEDGPAVSNGTDTILQGLDIYIFVAERWYIFPAPIFELADRNFNEWWKTKDFSRTNYGGYLYWNNFRGRNETVVLALRLGYTQQIGISYNIPYINRHQKDGLAISYSYNHNHEVGYHTDLNYLDYLNVPDLYVKREWQGGIQYSHRQAIYDTYYFSVDEHYASISDTVLKLNSDFFAKEMTSEKYVRFRFLFKHDERDNINYPLTGNYFDFEAVKNGLPVLSDDINFGFVTSQVKKYWKLWNKFYFASGAKGKFSSADPQPYYNTRALGYDGDYLRGYEYYVVNGQKFILLKTDFKYELLPVHYLHAGIIPSEKFSTIPYCFYLNLYADYGYVQDKQYYMYNPLTNSNLYSFGGGIDFASYYNFVLRVEYSINKFGQTGIFIHFTAPI